VTPGTPAAHLQPMTLDPAMAEPMLVGAMRGRPFGEVTHTPLRGPKSGTSTAGFLREFDEYVAARVAVETAALTTELETLRERIAAAEARRGKHGSSSFGMGHDAALDDLREGM